MRILLTGAQGQLGFEIVRRLAGSSWDVVATSRRELDVSRRDQVNEIFAAHRFDLVINAAAYTAVDRAETERNLAFRINSEAPAHLARLCAEHGAALIHISTDYVFDGTKETPYVEEDPPCPANIYGKSKEAGERAVRENLDRHVVLRTAWVFGAHGRNFVKTVLGLAAQRNALRIVSDQYGNPTAATDLAWCIARLTSRIEEALQGDAGFAWGTYNCVNEGRASWYEFAETIVCHAAGRLGHRAAVQPIRTEEYPTPARRPGNSCLDSTKLQQTLGITMPPWRSTLPGVIDEIFSGSASEPARSAL